MSQIHEYVVMKFKEGIDKDEQLATMRKLNRVLCPLAGFESREFFYSAVDDRWVDHIVWATMAEAVSAGRISDDPEASKLFKCFDRDSIVFGRYEKVS